ncbi:MAG: exodeoxyribonuclease VII small subunit [Chloroflexota bacterium]
MSEPLSFEESLTELAAIVERLQRPDVPLEESVELYKRGTALAEQSELLLSQAELQVQELTHAVRERFAEYTADAPDDTEGV